MNKNWHLNYNLLKNNKYYLVTFLVVFFMLALLVRWNNSIKFSYKNLECFPLPEIDPIWNRKIKTNQDMKIGIITDTHLRATRVDRKNKSADAVRYIDEDDRVPVNEFNRIMNYFKPNAIVHLGDIIEGTGDADYIGITSLKLVKKELEKNKVPIYWTIGNHDLRSVTKEQFKDAFGLDELNYVKDIGDYRLIFLDGNYNPNNVDNNFIGEEYLSGFVHPEELNWLEEQLKTDKIVFVFMHQAVAGAEFFGIDDFYKSAVPNWREVMVLFEKYNVAAFFNGHIEARYYKEINGVKYYSLTGTKKNLEFSKSYYELVINKGEPKLTMFYTENETQKRKTINFETGEEI